MIQCEQDPDSLHCCERREKWAQINALAQQSTFPATINETQAHQATIADSARRKDSESSSLGSDKRFLDSGDELFSNIKSSNNIDNDASAATAAADGDKNDKDDGIGCKHRMRFLIAWLGLAIAAVNCYAQATFCIAIVEMVLPADFVADFKGDELASLAQISALASSRDDSCPIEIRYRDYYDNWRFPQSPQNMTNSSPQPHREQEQHERASNNVIDISNRFNWDASRQGVLLGAFAIGTAPLQVLGGRLAEIYGAKWVLLAGCLGTALTNLATPFLAHFSFGLLVANRVLMGVAQAGMEPGLMCLLAEWLTPDETGLFISMLLFAICIGFFLGSLCSSFLLALGYGWPLAYYAAAALNLAVGLVWLLYASSRPAESKLISMEELKYVERKKSHQRRLASEKNDLYRVGLGSVVGDNYISPTTFAGLKSASAMDSCKDTAQQVSGEQQQRQQQRKQSEQQQQAPWMNIISTPSVWAFIVCKISIRWCADVLSIELPTYLANVLHLSIKLNGILNSVSSALFAIFSFLTGWLVNELLKSSFIIQDELEGERSVAQSGAAQSQIRQLKLSKTNLRKLMQSLASFGSAITVFLMTRYDCNILFSMSMLLVLSCCLVMGTGGELQIPYDMTARYPGTLHGMACTLSVSGWLAPPLIGLILGDQPSSRSRWSLVWYLTAAINLVGGLVFVLFADASPRDFDRRPSDWPARNKMRKRRPNNSSAAPANDGALPNGFKDDDQRSKCSLEQANGEPLGYYNIACKSTDSSPTLTSAHQRHVHCSTGGAEGLQSAGGQSRSDSDSVADLEAAGGGGEQQQNWTPYFDRELIRVRQVEGSCMKPVYLHHLHDSIIAHQPAVFPYRAEKNPLHAVTGDDISQLIIMLNSSSNRHGSELAQQSATGQRDGSSLNNGFRNMLNWFRRARGNRKEFGLVIEPQPQQQQQQPRPTLNGWNSPIVRGAQLEPALAARDHCQMGQTRERQPDQQLVAKSKRTTKPVGLGAEAAARRASKLEAVKKTITHL